MATRRVWLKNLDGEETIRWSVDYRRFIVTNSRGNNMFLTPNAILKVHPVRGVYLEDEVPSALENTDILFTSNSYERLHSRRIFR